MYSIKTYLHITSAHRSSHRSNMGTIRQLSNMKLTEQSRNAATAGTNNRRTIRSTITPAMQRLDALVASKADAVVTPLAELGDMLLSCQDVSAPCPVVALSGNWTHGTNSKTNGKYNID